MPFPSQDERHRRHLPANAKDLIFPPRGTKISTSLLTKSLHLQKQALEGFLADLDHFWFVLLSDLNHKNEDDSQSSSPLALAFLKRQAIVANEIVHFRSDSKQQITTLVKQEIELLRLHSRKSTSIR